jgi:hypothetical protein
VSGFEVLVPILAILVGGTMFIVPIVGLTARFALKPLVDSYAKARQSSVSDARVEILERRLNLLEDQVQHLERDNQRLMEDADFRLRLSERGRAAAPPPHAPGSSG